MMRSFRMFYRQRYLNYSEMYNCFMLKKAQFPPPPPKKKDLCSLCVVDFNLSFCQMSEAEISFSIKCSALQSSFIGISTSFKSWKSVTIEIFTMLNSKFLRNSTKFFF